MDKDTALDLALEALEYIENNYMSLPKSGSEAITAIKQALALDKKAENARELGLDYEPVLKDNSNYRLDPPVAEPVGCEGAIVNGRVYADRLEHDYKFECEAGPLHLCNDWVEFRRCFEWLAVHATLPAQPAPVQEPVAWMGTDIEGNPNKFRLNPFNGGVELYKKPQSVKVWDAEGYDALMQELELWKAAAKRPWFGLTPEDYKDIFKAQTCERVVQLAEAKLKEKNT